MPIVIIYVVHLYFDKVPSIELHKSFDAVIQPCIFLLFPSRSTTRKVMMTTPIPFPHPVLTRVIGKPTAVTLKILKKEIYANATSVFSNRGGGGLGHLGAVMDPAE